MLRENYLHLLKVTKTLKQTKAVLSTCKAILVRGSCFFFFFFFFFHFNFLKAKTTEYVLGRIPRRPVLKTRENKRASVVPCLSRAGKYAFVRLCVFLPSLFISFFPNTPKVSVEGFSLERHGKGSKNSS